MNKKNIWKRLQEEKLENKIGCYGNKTSADEIHLLEKKMNLKISGAYKKFISLYSSAVMPGHTIYGFEKRPLMGEEIITVADQTNFYKNYQKWPNIEDWIIISDDGSGNPIGLKPDGSVWLSDHDSNFEQIKLADNFEDFLEKLLDETLYE